MEIHSGHLYDYPHYYDLVFGSDWRAEYDFLEACFSKHVSGSVRRLFEPACGTGRLLFRYGKAGYEVAGLDLNERAVAYCNRRLKRYDLPESAWIGDMADFRVRKKYDAAFNTINSFRHLTTGPQAEAHLRCMAGALRRGGIYILGLHLTPLKGAPMDEESWYARRGHLQVNTWMHTIDRDMKRRLERFRMHYDVYTPTRQFRMMDEIEFRTYTSVQFDRMIRQIPEFRVLETYDFVYDIDQPIEVNATTEDVVYILQRM